MGEFAVNQESDEASGPSAAHQSGRYPIETEKLKALQPLAAGASNSAILAVHRLSDEELAWIDARESRAPLRAANTQQLLPSPPSAADDSSVNAAGEDASEPVLSALRPYYREPTLERVQLQFEDRSLDPSQNPLALSSLRPPDKRNVAHMQRVLTGVGALALVGVGYLAALASSGTGRQADTSFASARQSQAVAVSRIELVTPAHAQADSPSEWAEPQAGGTTRAPEVLWSAPSPVALEHIERAQPSQHADQPIENRQLEALAPQHVQPAARTVATTVRRPRAARARPAQQRADNNANAGLPSQPTREDIRAAVESTRAALQSCAGPSHGMTVAHITVLGSGRASSTNIEGAFAGTSQGSCMARALRGATFPRFSAPSLQVTYPFRL